jgi:hypothetical protein
MSYRDAEYRYHERIHGITSKSLKALDKVLPRLGYVHRIVGDYAGRDAVVKVYGSKGVARFSGFAWGYGGQGPRGLQVLLDRCGFDARADQLGNWMADEGFRLSRPEQLPVVDECDEACNYCPRERCLKDS